MSIRHHVRLPSDTSQGFCRYKGSSLNGAGQFLAVCCSKTSPLSTYLPSSFHCSLESRVFFLHLSQRREREKQRWCPKYSTLQSISDGALLIKCLMKNDSGVPTQMSSRRCFGCELSKTKSGTRAPPSHSSPHTMSYVVY